MRDFKVGALPLGYFIQCVGKQKEREYSISSYGI
jgi:sulfite reductase alpha subunit-like flavoprotein